MSDVSANELIREYFSLKAFLQGIAFFAVLFVLLCVWLAVNGDNTLEKRESKLASKTAEIIHTDQVPEIGPAGMEAPHETEQDIQNLEMLPSGLVKAPVEGLYIETDNGLLPVRETILTPFKAYRKPFDFGANANAKGIISIVIMDAGLSESLTQALLETLPAEVTLALSPYATGADQWREQSRTKGHETWMILPLEPREFPYEDPGPLSLMSNMSLEENQTRLRTVLAQTVGYPGVIGTRNPAFFDAEMNATPLIKEIYERGLGYVDFSTIQSVRPQTIALRENAPYAHNDIWIDEHTRADQIQMRFRELEQIAAERGLAIGMVYPHPVSLKELRRWLGTLERKNFVLAPLSAQVGQ